jgi:hypothetical protein
MNSDDPKIILRAALRVALARLKELTERGQTDHQIVASVSHLVSALSMAHTVQW